MDIVKPSEIFPRQSQAPNLTFMVRQTEIEQHLLNPFTDLTRDCRRGGLKTIFLCIHGWWRLWPNGKKKKKRGKEKKMDLTLVSRMLL